jgi:hypothetical protein
MVPVPGAAYLWIMMMPTASEPSVSPRAMSPLTVLAPLVLAVFGAYSMWVVVTEGYFGFLALAGREPWAMQLLLDLVIAASFAVGWMVRDARKRKIAAWPYVIATAVGGSLGVLAYCVRRSFTPRQGT